MYDYQGRSYLHIPQDVGVNLRSGEAPDKCYLPKKQIHVWSGHTKVRGRDISRFYLWDHIRVCVRVCGYSTVHTESRAYVTG